LTKSAFNFVSGENLNTLKANGSVSKTKSRMI
jgi:hypothetical protein